MSPDPHARNIEELERRLRDFAQRATMKWLRHVPYLMERIPGLTLFPVHGFGFCERVETAILLPIVEDELHRRDVVAFNELRDAGPETEWLPEDHDLFAMMFPKAR